MPDYSSTTGKCWASSGDGISQIWGCIGRSVIRQVFLCSSDGWNSVFLIHHANDLGLVRSIDRSNTYITNGTKLTCLIILLVFYKIEKYIIRKYNIFLSEFRYINLFLPQLLRCSFSSRKKFQINLLKTSNGDNMEVIRSPHIEYPISVKERETAQPNLNTKSSIMAK